MQPVARPPRQVLVQAPAVGQTAARPLHVAAPKPTSPTRQAPRTALGWMLQALASGRPALLPGHLPAYTGLAPAVMAGAVARGAGRVAAQPYTTDGPGVPGVDEPVSVVVTGDLASIKKAFEATGWVEAKPRTPWNFVRAGLSALLKWGDFPGAPVSAQFLAGQPEALAFNKHSDHNRGRDHLRIYPTTPDPATGKPRFAIAATRDVALSLTVPHRENRFPWPWNIQWKQVSIGHAVDPAIDRERDLIMHDLLAAGHVTEWAAVTGRRPAEVAERPVTGGFELAGKYRTDGRVFEAVLR